RARADETVKRLVAVRGAALRTGAVADGVVGVGFICQRRVARRSQTIKGVVAINVGAALIEVLDDVTRRVELVAVARNDLLSFDRGYSSQAIQSVICVISVNAVRQHPRNEF